MKKLQTQKAVSKLRLHKETLRQLEKSELLQVGGGFSGTSICTETTIQCCVTK